MKNRLHPTSDHLYGGDDLVEIRKKADKQGRDADRYSNIALAISILAFVVSLLGALPLVVDALSLPH